MKSHISFQEQTTYLEEIRSQMVCQNEYQAMYPGSVRLQKPQEQGVSCKRSKDQSQLQETQL